MRILIHRQQMCKHSRCNIAVETASLRTDAEMMLNSAFLSKCGLNEVPLAPRGWMWAHFLQAQLWFRSGVAAAVVSCHFGGDAGGVQVVLKQIQHPPLVGLYGKKVDDGIQAAVQVH